MRRALWQAGPDTGRPRRRAAKRAAELPEVNIERISRRLAGEALVREQVIPSMIDRIKSLFDKRSSRE